MGMFDYYVPDPALACPVCARPLAEWQGKCGPCALLVWRQAEAAPVEQRAGECNLSGSDRSAWRLPPDFEIYSHDCGCPFPVEARGRCEEGVWRVTELVTAENARRSPHERKERWNRRLRWLASGGSG